MSLCRIGLSRGLVIFLNIHEVVGSAIVIGEGFILLTKILHIDGWVPLPFDRLKFCTRTYGMKLKLF